MQDHGLGLGNQLRTFNFPIVYYLFSAQGLVRGKARTVADADIELGFYGRLIYRILVPPSQ